MSKLKIHSGASKRFKKTGSSLMRKKSGKRHILTKRTTKNKRQLRGTFPISRDDKKKVNRLLKKGN